MNKTDLLAILPLIILTVSCILVMLAIAVRRHHGFTVLLTAFGLMAALLSLPISSELAPHHVTQLLIIDGYAVFYLAIILISTLAITAFSYHYWRARDGQHEEYYILLLTSALGAAVLVCASHFASLFLGLELVSVSLFALIAHARPARLPLEGSIKYLIIGGVSSCFLLFGIALIYARFGTLSFSGLDLLLGTGITHNSLLWASGFTLIIVGIGFKLALAPFHMWTPDVYESAPAPVSAFVATVSKGAMFALLLRYVAKNQILHNSEVFTALSFMAFASILVGNLLALRQNNVKRILGYSSIAHLGYLLVALLAAGDYAITAVSFYLVFYMVTMLGAFGIVGHLSLQDEGELQQLDDYRGLFWSRPWLAGLLTLLLFSLTGIPLTLGFLGKFYILLAAVNSQLWLLVLTLIIGSGIGVYYYLRIIINLFATDSALRHSAPLTNALASSATLFGVAGLTLWWGAYPAPLLHLITSLILGN